MNQANQREKHGADAAYVWEPHTAWTRETEASMVNALVSAIKTGRVPASANEADVYRFTAQLLKSRHQEAAAAMDSAAREFFARHAQTPRSFPEVLSDGLLNEPSRLRNLLENGLAGVRTW